MLTPLQFTSEFFHAGKNIRRTVDVGGTVTMTSEDGSTYLKVEPDLWWKGYSDGSPITPGNVMSRTERERQLVSALDAAFVKVENELPVEELTSIECSHIGCSTAAQVPVRGDLAQLTFRADGWRSKRGGGAECPTHSGAGPYPVKPNVRTVVTLGGGW